MRTFIDSIRHLTHPTRTIEREIAPGVRVQVRPIRRSFALTHRVHEAWDTLRGRNTGSGDPLIQQRLRRAA